MTHSTLVAFTKDHDAPEADIAQLMAPYDENTWTEAYWESGERLPYSWDWYCIGGRWDGRMRDLVPLPDKDNGFNFGDEFHELTRNSCFPINIDPEFTPFAFLTPDGQVYARKIWDGEHWNDTEGWQQMWTEAKGAFSDCLAVCLDVHD